jgi:hypothetical protein
MRQTSAHSCSKFFTELFLCFVFGYFLLIFCSSRQDTALHFAARNGHTAACQLLMSAKADVNANNRHSDIFELFHLFCVVFFSHNFSSLASLQFGRDSPQTGHRQGKIRRCGIAAQRWRCRMSAFDQLPCHAIMHVQHHKLKSTIPFEITAATAIMTWGSRMQARRGGAWGQPA